MAEEFLRHLPQAVRLAVAAWKKERQDIGGKAPKIASPQEAEGNRSGLDLGFSLIENGQRTGIQCPDPGEPVHPAGDGQLFGLDHGRNDERFADDMLPSRLDALKSEQEGGRILKHVVQRARDTEIHR